MRNNEFLRRTVPIVITIWGDFACWTRPECKVERVSYPFPTPGGMRGLLSSIYSKPPEFYWQIMRIELLKPIRTITIKRNEVKSTFTLNRKSPKDSIIWIEDDRTQRQTTALRDVKYRVTAEMVLRPEFKGTAAAVRAQFIRRATRGQNFCQPYLGLREFPAYYEIGSTGEPPINDTVEQGLMLYDVFDLNKWKVTAKTEPSVSLYSAVMCNGVIDIPPYESPSVWKPGKEAFQC